MNEQTRNSYAEVLEILKYLKEDDYNKIPQKEIQALKINANPNYKFNYNPNKKLNEQEVLEQTKLIIAMFFCDYWANEQQKKKIYAYDKEYENQQELYKQEKYNPDNIFERKKKTVEKVDGNSLSEIAIVEYKEKNIIHKIIDKIKRLFNRC